MNFKNFIVKLVSFLIIFISSIYFTALASENDDTSKNNNKKIIYLTFDDGPAGKITSNVLDILKEENVPATFFLIGDQLKGQDNLVKRIHDEGHSIGLHSMTHEKCHLYSSNDGFLKEMLEEQECLNSILGFKPCILRFPFGCNNNTYKLSQNMIDLLHENNLKIYDWNTDSGDGANPNSAPSQIAKNSITDKDTVVLLMHCGYQSKNSVKALDSIIKHYKDNNYEFKAITEDTPEEFHIMKKCKQR